MLQINQLLESLLNKGFRAPKCKTLLKLASSRINVLRSKRSIQLKQMSDELAKLLGNGQEATAQIKVEHVIREQNILRVYDKLHIFCELLIVRMPIIESQRECPIDLQEAIASLIYAAPRIPDMPELMEIQQMLSSRYGPELTAAVAELRADCHVDRLIVEMLSAQTPSIKIKLNVMKEVAEEHGVEWDVTNFELGNLNESQDLLDGNRKLIEPIQMLPIPLPEESNLLEVGSASPEDSYPPSTQGTIESSGLTDPGKLVPISAASSNRFYSPPRESSITQRSDLLEEIILKRAHSRTKSEGSISLQDIIDAADAAAESAEKAAQAARAAAEIARSRKYSRFAEKQESMIHSMNRPTVANEISPSVRKLESSGHDRPKEKAGNVDPSLKHDNFSEQLTVDEEEDAYQNMLNRVLKFQAMADSYGWTQKGASNESGLLSDHEEDVSGKDHGGNVFWRNKDACNEKRHNVYMKLDDNYDWTPQERACHDIDDGQLVSYDSLETNPFWDRAAGSLSVTSDLASLDAASRFEHYEEKTESSLPEYDGPKFDNSRPGSYQEPIHRSQSLEDDPYYTYPNLFSKSSHH